MKNSIKSGVSLIAVLLFMLAATTASIVIFRWISQENFSSGSRLKGSEAYQASQAGLEATKGWLANKAADVGAVLKIFDEQTGAKKPIRLVNQLDNDKDLLAGDNFKNNNSKQQKFEVYLTAANMQGLTYKLKFLSVGTARDGSKHSQVGIFDVEGLYNVVAHVPPPPGTAPQAPAFHGGMGKNTQGKFESANISGHADVNGISTSGNLIVAGDLTTQDNAQSRIGCKGNDANKAADNERTGDMYVLGDCNIRKFTVCGDAYIEGHMTAMGPTFRGDLYANNGITNNGGEGITIKGALTLGGDYNLRNSNNTVEGDFVLEDNGYLIIQNDSKITASGDVWSWHDLFKNTVSGNKNDNNKYNELKLGGTGKKLSIPIKSYQSPQPTGKAVNCGNSSAFGCAGDTKRWYQDTYSQNRDTAHFITNGSQQAPIQGNPPAGNKPLGAKKLEDMRDQIVNCSSTSGKCVKDPLEVPKTGGVPVWKAPAQELARLVSIGDTASLPKACLRLVKPLTGDPNSGGNPGFGSHWCFGDNLNGVNNPNAGDYPSMGSGDKKYNFIRAANDCYAKLKLNDPKNILYPANEPDVNKKFLPVVAKADQNGRDGYFNGNFIFYFPDDMNQQMKFPPTTTNSKVFVYFEKGATGTIPWTNSCVDGYCKRNYFIFSEKDITGTSGSGTLNGAVFLANGAKLGGSAPDLTIEFNQELYQALVDVGIVTGPSNNPVIDQNSINRVDDVYHIPSTPHLKVKLESQYASDEKPPEASNYLKVKPSVMVLPRVIYARPGQINMGNIQNYYNVLYMNGAIPPAKATPTANENPPTSCNPLTSNSSPLNSSDNGLYECKLTSNSCGSSPCDEHRFYVLVTNSALSGGGGGDPYEPPPAGTVTLYCAGIAGTEVAQGTSVSAPALTCSNGATPSSISWLSDAGPFSWWGTNTIPPGNFNNIKAVATCGSSSNLTSTSCGNLKVTSNISLACGIANNTVVEAGSDIASAGINMTCNNSTETPSGRQYSNVGGSQTSLAAGIYSDVTVKANCGLVTDLTANCPGTLTVAGLACTPKDLYAKAGGTISTGLPTLTCTPSNGCSSPTFYDEANPAQVWDWTVPQTSSAGIQFKIKGKASYSGLNLTADCGTVTVAGITCNVPSSVRAGEPIPAPTLICNNGGNPTGPSYTVNGASVSSLPTSAANQFYDIGGTVHCDNSLNHLRNISFTCPTVTGTATDRCEYLASWCDGISYSAVIKGTNYNAVTGGGSSDWVNGPLCVFANSISQMGNNTSGQVIRVNGQVLSAKAGGANPEGRCGGTGADWKTNNQQSCSDALLNIPKADGGYYIYIPPGGVGQNFEVTGRAASSACTSTSFGCEYRQEWCGGKTPEQITYNSTAMPTTVGTCMFIKDFIFGAIQPKLNSAISINGNTNACGSAWSECPYNAVPPKADGGYYVYLESGTSGIVNRWRTASNGAGSDSIVSGAMPSACDPSNKVSCNGNFASCYLVSTANTNNALIPIPALTCPNSGTVGQAEFYIFNPGTNNETEVANWNSASPTPYSPRNAGDNRAITLRSLVCNGDKQTFSPPIDCGSLNIRSSCDDQPPPTGPTISCVTNNTGCYEGSNITQVPRPSVYCSDGTTPGIAEFFYNGSNPATGWNSPGGTQPFSSTGNRPITLKSLYCGSTKVEPSSAVSCGNVTIVASGSCGGTPTPTVTSCTMGSVTIPTPNGTCYTISKPNITINCSDGTTGTAPTFEVNGTVLNWNTGAAHQFCNAGTREVKLTSAACGSNNNTGLSITCGSFIIPSSSSAASSSSSAPVSSSSARTQTTNCDNYIGNLPANPNPPANPYTACFKHPTNNNCYVCKIASEGSGQTCASNWVWTGDGEFNNNISNGYWYQQVTCPSGGGDCVSTHTFSGATTSWVKFCSGNITMKQSGGGCNIQCYGASGFSPCSPNKYISNLPGSQSNPGTTDIQGSETVICNNVPDGLFCRASNCW
jgi:hypothetical protein